jgi:hypothetical protein
MSAGACPDAVPEGLNLIGMHLEVSDFGRQAEATGIVVHGGQCRTFTPATEAVDGGWFIRP